MGRELAYHILHYWSEVSRHKATIKDVAVAVAFFASCYMVRIGYYWDDTNNR